MNCSSARRSPRLVNWASCSYSCTRTAELVLANEANFFDFLTKERVNLLGAIKGKTIALIEAVRTWVVLGHPEVAGVCAAHRFEHLLADASALVGLKQVNEVQLTLAGGVDITRRPGADKANNLTVYDCGELVKLFALFEPVAPQLGDTPRRQVCQGSFRDEVIVGLVPTLRVHPTQRLKVGIANWPNHNINVAACVHGHERTTVRGIHQIGCVEL